MGISIENNSMLHLDELVDMYKHYLILVDKSKISAVKFYDEHVEIFSTKDMLARFYYGKSYIGNGYIFSFNQRTGEGVIRVKNGDYISFFSSNVETANSKIPHLVTNVDLLPGDRIKFKLSSECSTVGHIGAVDIRKIA